MNRILKKIKLNKDIEYYKIDQFKNEFFGIHAFASNPLGIINVDKSGVITAINSAALRMFNKIIDINNETHVSTLFPSSIIETYSGKILNRFFNIWVRKNLNNWVEIVFNNENGIKSCFLIFAQNIKIDCHDMTSITFKDVSEKRKLDYELIKIKAAVDSAQEAIFITDINGVFTYVNPMFTKLYGYQSDEVLGLKTPRILKSTFIKKDVENFWRKLTQNEKIPLMQYQNRKKDGTYIDIEGSAEPILDEKGNSIGFLGIHRDIEERVKTLDLLKEALLKAEEAYRLKAEFLANMSHEFRTPLNGILGLTDLVDSNTTTEEMIEYTKQINFSGQRLLEMVERLFEISLIRAGQVNIKKKAFYLHAFLIGLDIKIKKDRRSMNKNHIRLHLKSNDADKDFVLCNDEFKLNKILLYLLKNALKYTDEGYIEYGYKIDKKNEPPTILFYIKDTGCGINEEYKEIIFEPFRQADGSVTRKHEGTGLGLAIVKSLIDQLGGKIWFDSKLNQGSTFFVQLPLNDS